MSELLPGISESCAKKDPDVAKLISFHNRLQTAVNDTVRQNLHRLVEVASWGLLHSMYTRVLEQNAACITLYANGYAAPSEALCRTVVEGAVNLFYCSVQEPCEAALLTY